MVKKIGKAAATIIKWYSLFNGACWAFVGIGMWLKKACDTEEDNAVWDIDAALMEFLEESWSGYKRYWKMLKPLFM